MDSVRSGPFGQIFRPDNFIFGQVGHSACLQDRRVQPLAVASRTTLTFTILQRGSAAQRSSPYAV